MKKIFLLTAIFFLSALAFCAEPELICAARPPKNVAAAKINYDFTKMNYNMASGIVFDMMIDPETYKNKTAKIQGEFRSEVHEGKRLCAVVVWDAGGCCPTGLTVVPLAGKKYPADFPAEGSKTTVTGALEILELFGSPALCLVADLWE